MKWWGQAVAKWKSGPLVRGTGVFLVGSAVVNFGSFAYHVIMARLLGPVDYGILGSLIGLTYVLTIPTQGLDLLIVKMVASFKDRDGYGAIKSFVLYLGRKLIPWLAALGLILGVATWPVAKFLHLQSWYGVALVWVGVYLVVVTTVGLAILRGLLQFGQMVVNQILSVGLKVAFSVGAVLGGVHSYLGAQLGTVASMLVAAAALAYPAWPIIKARPAHIKTTGLKLRHQGLVALLFSAAFVSMYSLDVVLVRHFLPQFEAGIYASLVTAGRIVFFALSPVAVVLLPVVARKAQRPQLARSDLVMAARMAMVGGMIVVAAYFALPQLIVDILFTAQFDRAAIFLPWFGLAMWGYSLAHIFGSFLLALNQTRVIGYAASALTLEVISITLFHANLWQIVGGLAIVFWLLAGVLFKKCWDQMNHA